MQQRHVMKASLIAVGCALAVSAAAAPNPAARGSLTRAIPAGIVTFDGGNCTARFVRSASGIVHETRRQCIGEQNPWVDEDVVIHFRPLDGRPNPECDPEGLVTTFVYTNTDPALAQYFPEGTQYNACVYLEDPTIEEGTIDAVSATGTTSEGVPLPGRYEVCVRGTYTSGTLSADAEYTSTDNWATFMDGTAAGGANYGDVQVNGQFVSWGDYNTNHKYCTVVTLAQDATVTLAVFEGTGTTQDAAAYADNNGLLDYTITYLGP